MNARTKDRLEPWVYVALAAYWAGWGAFVCVLTDYPRPWLGAALAYALWQCVLQDLYCKITGVRFTVVVECEDTIVTAHEFAFQWQAMRKAKSLQREYRWLTVGRPQGAVQIRVNETHKHTVYIDGRVR